MLLLNEDSYRILYFNEHNWFVIELLAPPFEEARVKAEQEFLRLLGDGSELACGLSVIVVDEQGAILPLGTCQ